MSVRGSVGWTVIVAGLLAAAPALAVSVDQDRSNPPAAKSSGKSKPDYNFTGNGYNLSISRTPDAPEDGNRSSDKDRSRSERTWLERVQKFIEDIIGD